MSEQNERHGGVAVGNGHAPQPLDVDPGAVIAHLSSQLAALHQQIAMRDAYIDQLHRALSDIAGEEVNP